MATTVHTPVKTKSRLRRWTPVVLWAVLISIFSTHYFGNDQTGHVILKILAWIMPGAKLHTLNLLHHVIRKCAHVFEYFIFSMLLIHALRSGHPTAPRWMLAAIAIAIVGSYACLDEFHQVFVPGRTPAVTDVLLDTASGVLAQSFAALVGTDEGEEVAENSEVA